MFVVSETSDIGVAQDAPSVSEIPPYSYENEVSEDYLGLPSEGLGLERDFSPAHILARSTRIAPIDPDAENESFLFPDDQVTQIGENLNADILTEEFQPIDTEIRSIGEDLDPDGLEDQFEPIDTQVFNVGLIQDPDSPDPVTNSDHQVINLGALISAD